MADKHTPGPWFADKIQDRSAFNIFMPGYCSAGASVHHCANASGCMGGLEVAANARLMAAAPELLAALQRALDAGIGSDGRRPSAADEARAAIANATGDGVANG